MNKPLVPELPGFNDPIAVLRACHDRMLDHCELLERLLTHIADKGPDEEASSAASKVHRYFSTAAVHHHQDEEQDLFPILARQNSILAEMIYAFKKEHTQLDALWRKLAVDLKQVQNIEGNTAFADSARAFCHLTRDHVTRENNDFLPRAQHSLSAKQLCDIGQAMEKRRRGG